MNAETAARIAALRSQVAAGAPASRILPTGRSGSWLSIDPDGRLHLLFQAKPTDHPPASLEQVSIARHDYLINDTVVATVDVTCNHPDLQDVFEHFIDACLTRASHTDAIAALTLELATWKTFLAAVPGPPGLDRCIELFGELLVADDLAAHDPAALRAWVGTRHDFRAGSDAIEVKTTRATTGNAITVHGIDQLQPPVDGTLHLHFVRVEHTPGHGRSVADLVDSLLNRGVAAELIFRHAEDHHIAPAQIPQTRTLTFDVRERVTVPVTDRTPRLSAIQLIDGRLPAGVSDVTYRLDLTGILPAGLDDTTWHALTRSLADQAEATP